MKKLYLLLILLSLSFVSYSQNASPNASPIKKIETTPADTLTYKVLLNENNINIDIEIRKKINFYRKSEDYIWEPETGLKILIYKK